jgi:DNA polymerase
MAFKKLHIDIETYSSIDIMASGAYKYMESVDFEVLMVAYAFDNEPVKIIDLAQNEKLPSYFLEALQDPDIIKKAHNANFERQAFKKLGFDIPTEFWECTAIKAAYCGLPLSLDQVSKAMNLEEKGKSSTGKALIRFFSCPQKPTKKNGFSFRNFPENDLEKWAEFKDYCMQDVEAEREISRRLEIYTIPNFEKVNYILDQKINDKGIKIDVNMATNAVQMDSIFTNKLLTRAKELTNLENPKSPAQLKEWLSSKMQKEIKTLAKENLNDLILEAEAGPILEVLKLRKKLAKSSTKKYTAMLNCVCEDVRAHGLFQFYGASRTGRWAGRLIQLQNLPQNHITLLQDARDLITSNDYDLATMMYDDISSLLSQLIRTAFVAKENHTFAVADFSAIEARVIAWLADEKWRLEVFNSHGKIYEASASMMFNVPIEQITKGSDLRDKGKIAELALGYQGALGALKQMGGEKMGLSDIEMATIVKKWRKANPAIVGLWKEIEDCANRAIKTKKVVVSKHKNLEFDSDGDVLTIKLPSGRKLFYQKPSFSINKWGKESIKYKGMSQTTRQWVYVDTYGGKLVENIIQAIARDLLAYSMQRIDVEGFDIVMHVHDEAVCEIPKRHANAKLEFMCEIMGEPVPWAPGLPLTADGYITDFYKKD